MFPIYFYLFVTGAHHHYDDFVLPNPKFGLIDLVKSIFKIQPQQMQNLKKDYIKEALGYYMKEFCPLQAEKMCDLLANMGQVQIMYRNLAYQHLKAPQSIVSFVTDSDGSLKKV
jgi:hypothetical protein